MPRKSSNIFDEVTLNDLLSYAFRKKQQKNLLLTDGKYSYSQLSHLFKSDWFSSEKEMCNFFEKWIKKYTSTIFWEKYCKHKREFPVVNTSFYDWKKPSVDFYIETKKGDYILEFKSPSCVFWELSSAIWQCLSYLTLCRTFGKKIEHVYLVTDKICDRVLLTIRKNNLPIKLVLFNFNYLAVIDE